MTKTKIQKTVAIVIAMCLAFALMSVTMMNNAKAEATKFEKETYTLEFEEPEMAVSSQNDNYYVAVRDSYEGTPSFTVKFTFKGNDGTFLDQDVTEFVKLYSDSQLTTEVTIPADYFVDHTANTASEVSFTLRLNLLGSLESNKTYYLKLDKALSASADTIGDDIVIQFAIPGTSTTSTTTSTTKSTTKSTTRTTRTVTTRYTTRTVRTVTTKYSGVKAKSANTGDESNMPLWIAVAILAAGGSAIAYVWKEQE